MARVLEVEPPGRARELEPRLGELHLVHIHTDHLRLAELVLPGDDLGLGRDDPAKGGLVDEGEGAQDHMPLLRPVAGGESAG